MQRLSEVLKNELTLRSQKNSSYSLRAFAKNLQIEASSLSKIINNKRIPREDTIRKILSKIDISPKDVEYIVDIERSELRLKNFKIKKDLEVPKIEINDESINSDSIHYKILELLKLSECDYTITWFEKKLGVAPEVVGKALKRLEGLNMIEFYGMKIIDKTDNTSKKLKNNKDLVNEILNSTNNLSLIVATQKEKIQEAQRRVERFQEELASFLSSGTDKDCLYSVNVGCLKVDKDRLVQ